MSGDANHLVDQELLAEIDLLSELMLAAGRSAGMLTQTEVDAVLGLLLSPADGTGHDPLAG